MLYSIRQLSRFTRIILIWLFTIGVVLAVFPLVDAIYIRYFFQRETIVLPSYVSAIIVGGGMYLWGWRVLLSESNNTEKGVKWGLLVYLSISLFACLMSIVLIAHGFILLNGATVL